MPRNAAQSADVTRPAELISTASYMRPIAWYSNNRKSVPSDTNSVKAFSLLEICVAIAILAILLALVVASARRTREGAQATICQSHLRQLGGLLTLYTNDFRGYYPTYVADSVQVVADPRWWAAYTGQSRRIFATQGWFRYTGMELQKPVYRCPANQLQKSTLIAASDYLGVQVMHGDPSFFDPALPKAEWRSRLAAKPQLVENVLFPGEKTGLWELSVWHGWRGTWTPGHAISGLSYTESVRPSSMWFFDGHVEGLTFDAIENGVDRRPVWASGKLLTTPDGARGRDVVRGSKMKQ
jgi:prepilin-type N-terminal cleavage/methylation domain-containing protein/prepilin-type processing-associated H-X9-DG protein